MVIFKDIPAVTLVPFVWMEFDATKSRPASSVQPYKLLNIGQRLNAATTAWAVTTAYTVGQLILNNAKSYICTVAHTSTAADEPGVGANEKNFWGEYVAGTESALVPRQVTSGNEASTLFGRGSHLHGLASALFQNNLVTEAWFVAQDDNSGTALNMTVTFAGVPTAAGTIFIYIAGVRFAVGVAASAAVDTYGAAVAAAIQADTSLPVVVSYDAATDKLSIVAKNQGTVSNDLDVRFNYFRGEEFPLGMTVPVVATVTAGATDPDVSLVWAVLGDVHYNVFGMTYNDTANIAALEVELLERYQPDRAIDAVGILTIQDTHANLLTTASPRNAQMVSIMGVEAFPTPPWHMTGTLVGNVGRSAMTDPALPFQNMVCKGIRAPKSTDEFTLQEQELLLAAGIAIFQTNAAGEVLIGRMVSTYTKDSQGAPDDTFRDLNTSLTLGFFRFDMRNALTKAFPQHKLAGDDVKFQPGQKIVTPSLMRAEVIAIARGWADRGLLEDFAGFKKSVTVVRDVALDPNRLDILITPDVVNQFRVARIQAQFRL